MQKKGEKTSPENLVPICPALSRFVHQPPILQHCPVLKKVYKKE